MTKILLVPEVAEVLRCTQRHVRDLIRGGHLKAFSVGVGKRASYRIAESDLDAFIASGSQATAEPATPPPPPPMRILPGCGDFAKAVRRFTDRK